MTHKVYAPNIHLFAFHQRSGLSNDFSPIGLDDTLLWQKCDEIFEKLEIDSLKLSEKLSTHKLSDSPRVDLLAGSHLKNDTLSLPFDGHVLLDDCQAIKIGGFVYPLQTHDSYALWLNLRRPDRENGQKTPDVEMSLLGKLNPENCLLPEFIDSSLGQTLLITAWLSDGHNYQDKLYLKELADQCIRAFISDPEKRPPFNRDGLLFGSPIFEYGIINQSPPYRHVLVWLLVNSVTEIKFSKCSTELMDLFYYRNKIVRTYKISRDIYQFIRGGYKDIESTVNLIQESCEGFDLKEDELMRFQELLKRIPKQALEYSRSLQDLEQCHHAIGINVQKYQQKLAQIQAKLQADKLDFLEIFCQKNCPYLQEEIQADLRYFERGSGLLEKMLSAIRGIVEIEKTKHVKRSQPGEAIATSRQLENRYFLEPLVGLGIGVATGAVVASSCVYLKPENATRSPLNATNLPFFSLSVLASALCGFAAGWFARQIAQRCRKDAS